MRLEAANQTSRRNTCFHSFYSFYTRHVQHEDFYTGKCATASYVNIGMLPRCDASTSSFSCIAILSMY